MFTDEKMELMYSKNGIKGCLEVLLDFMRSNSASPSFAIKQADNIWRLFVKRHPVFDPEMFSYLVIESANTDDLKNKLIKLLKG